MDSSKYQPLVSIIIPIYNGSNYMIKAIESALNQTYKNIEILVINDGSNDQGKTEKIAKSYENKIRYFFKSNGGVSSALNLGIKNMKGEYFSWLSHDDEYTNDKIEKQIELLNKYSDKTLIAHCNCMQIDKNSKPLSFSNTTAPFNKTDINEWSTVLMYLLKKGTFNGCSLLIPKCIFDKCGTFDETLQYNQDSFMWYKIFLNRYQLVYSSDVCVLSRVHEEQLTQTGKALFHKDCEIMSEYLISEFIKISKKSQNFLLAYAKYNAKYNNNAIVLKCISKAKSVRLFSVFGIFKLNIIMMYGIIRPYIKRLYYKFVKGIAIK